ncbi:hypothetical protein [Streptomyces prasinopilosus]|uniref:Transcriptional regulator, AbiEi antitoxin, Type IV TA system n=1 Tax=Streptomyces prasinopilosus TaxID=67344 RepID=A0A1G6IQT5_9ACTN|nr:hypothetical protein [Streptomyces prasinopilosus]SDC08932.1 hypothetical protein SAMN05216505_101360 [Streptomyces prasinopilosus]
MNHDSPLPPLSPRPPHHLAAGPRRVLTTARLRSHGVPAAEIDDRCRPGGPWQRLLPGVVLLHPGPPSSEERLHAVLLYAARERSARVLAQPGPADSTAPRYEDAMITGPAALALHGFPSAPPLPSLEVLDVLVPRLRRLRSTGCVRIVRTPVLPAPERVAGVPVAPVPRALADAVAVLEGADAGAGAVRRLLGEAVAGGHCEAGALVRELTDAKLLGRPHVVRAVASLLAEGRAHAEGGLYRMVREHALPDPLWNVDLRLPGGPHLGGLDAYWPEQAVALHLDTRREDLPDGGVPRSGHAREREHLERLGITVVRVTPRGLRDATEQQAAVVRTALMAADDRDPAAYVVVLPR